MSRGYDYDERDWQGPKVPASHTSVYQGRSGANAEAPEKNSDRILERGSGNSVRDPKSREPSEIRYGRQLYRVSELERAMMVEIGRFRTLDEEDVARVFYGKP